MKIFVSGATGFIGSHLCQRLAQSGHTVHALYRSKNKTGSLQHPYIQLFRGDILDRESLEKAMEGCSQAYHTAAFTDIWVKDEKIIYELNVTATLNVLELAGRLKINDVVFSSTAGVLGPSNESETTEDTVRQTDYFLEYERTKAIAEQKAIEFARNGMNVKIVNPTRVFGPGVLNPSNSVTKMIASYLEGKWRFIPGNGRSIGNYAFIEDVVDGHIKAMEKGKAGEKYILGGENLSYDDFFRILGEISGKPRHMFRLPLPFMYLAADIARATNKMLGVKPFITKALVRKFNYNWQTSSQKAIRELGYSITPFPEAIRKTIDWIRNNRD